MFLIGIDRKNCIYSDRVPLKTFSSEDEDGRRSQTETNQKSEVLPTNIGVGKSLKMSKVAEPGHIYEEKLRIFDVNCRPEMASNFQNGHENRLTPPSCERNTVMQNHKIQQMTKRKSRWSEGYSGNRSLILDSQNVESKFDLNAAGLDKLLQIVDVNNTKSMNVKMQSDDVEYRRVYLMHSPGLSYKLKHINALYSIADEEKRNYFDNLEQSDIRMKERVTELKMKQSISAIDRSMQRNLVNTTGIKTGAFLIHKRAGPSPIAEDRDLMDLFKLTALELNRGHFKAVGTHRVDITFYPKNMGSARVKISTTDEDHQSVFGEIQKILSGDFSNSRISFKFDAVRLAGIRREVYNYRGVKVTAAFGDMMIDPSELAKEIEKILI